MDVDSVDQTRTTQTSINYNLWSCSLVPQEQLPSNVKHCGIRTPKARGIGAVDVEIPEIVATVVFHPRVILR